jgi:trimeric autotransporter adhesin
MTKCPRPFVSTVPLLLLVTLLAGLWLAPALRGQGEWSPHFDMPGFGIAGRVFTLGTWRNELIAGTYNMPWRDGNRLQHVGRFDGVRWHALGTGVNDHVRAICEFQGDLYIGGNFTGAGSTPTAHIAKWNGTQWSAVGAGFDDEVWSLCVHQGELYAGGLFTHSGGTVVNGIARWNGTSWQPLGTGLQWLLGQYACGRTLLSDGADLYVGGDFDRAGGVPCSYVARWNGTTWSPLGGGINNFGWAMVWQLCKHQGRIYCAGAFGQAGSALSDNLAAWDGSQWHAVGAGLQNSTYGVAANSLCEWNGELYVGGGFNRTGNTPLHRIAKLVGQQLQPVGGVDRAEANPPTIFAMTTWNGRLWCGGEFQVAGNPDVLTETIGVYHVTSYDGADWHAAGGGLGLDNEVHVLGHFQGQAIAGGRFGIAGGRRAPGLARFDGDDWQPFGVFDGLVTDMCEHNGELWVAGEFYSVNGIGADGVARFDGTAWHAVGGGPGPHRAYCIASYQGMIHIGSIGTPKRWTGSVWQTFTPAIFGALTTMHVHNGVLYIGGSTPFHAGSPNLFAWDGTTLTVPGGGLNDPVEGLGSFGGELIVGGRFTTAGGIPARAIAKWNGSTWSTFAGVGIQGATVRAITTFRNELVIGGDFSVFQGAPADYVARWTGSAWAPLAAQQPNGSIFALLADDARGELLAGGWYFLIGTQDAGHLCAFEAQPFWTDGGAPLANARRAPRLTGDGRLLPGARTRWRLSSATENSLGVFVAGAARIDVPMFGGVLVPSPDALLLWVTDAAGTATFELPWPGPLPGASLWTQGWVLDPTGPQGFTASNGVWLRAP